jgi:hypothetical protein
MARDSNHGAGEFSLAVQVCRWLVAAWLFAVTPTISAEQQAAAGIGAEVPDTLKGTWLVKAVRVDLAATRTLHYQRDDPQLLGTRFKIGDTRIETNTPESRECLRPKVLVWKSTAAAFLATTMAAHGDPAAPATLKSYELPLAEDAPVSVLWITCQSGRFGPRASAAARHAVGADDIGTWILVLPSGELAVRWFDETILLLRHAS